MSRVTPPTVIVHRYSAWVCADTMTLIDGSSRLAMSAMALPARLPAQPLSAAVVWKPPSWMTRTEVSTPRRFNCRDGTVGRVGLVLEREPRHARGRDDRGRGLEHLTDEPDLELLAAVGLEPLGPERREQGLAGGIDHHVGRQVLEVGTGVDVGGPAVRERVRRGRAALGWVASAVLDAQQLVAALVELVVAHRREVDVHQVAGDGDGLFEEQPVGQGTGADVVARENGRLQVPVRGLAVLHRLGQVGGAAGELSVDVVPRGLEIAVEVVEGEEVDVGRALLGGLRPRRRSSPRPGRISSGPPRW